MLWAISREALEEAARLAAANHNLDPALVMAVVEQESNWHPWAIRYEPLFYTKYVLPLALLPTEAHARSFSYGLLQIMGQTARELGYKLELPRLCEPDIGLDWGCLFLEHKMKAHNDNVTDALLAYNGGGWQGYPGSVLAKVDKYRTPQVIQSPDLSTQV